MKAQIFKSRWFLGGISALIVSLVVLLDGTPFLLSDSYAYYHSAKSFVDTGKVYTDSEPEYDRYSPYVSEFNGKYLTIVNPGNAFLTIPGLEISKLVDANANRTIYNDYYKAFNGHSFADGFAILITDVLLAVGSIAFIYLSLRELGHTKKLSIVATFATAASTYVYNYSVELIGFTHIPELFGVSGALYFTLKCTKNITSQKNVTKQTLVNAGLLGIMASIAISARPTNLLIILPIGLYLVLSFFNEGKIKKQLLEKKRDLFKTVIAVIVGALPFALAFFAYNYTLYGGIFNSGYSVVAGAGAIFSLSQWHILELLFSPIRGWFVYTPIALVSLVVLVRNYVRSRLALITILPIALTVLLYSIFPYWWAGHSIGQRFFIVLTPFIAIGVAKLIEMTAKLSITKQRILKALIVILVAYSLSITFLSRFTPLQSLYGRYQTASEYIANIPQEEAFTPIDIYRYHLDTLRSATSIKDYVNKLQGGFQGARSIVLLIAGQTDPIVKVEPVSENEIKLHIIPNTRNKQIVADIRTFIVKEGRIESLQFDSVDFSVYSEIEIGCEKNRCASNDLRFNASKYYQSSEIPTSNSLTKYDNYSVGVGYADPSFIGDKVKFVDEKLYK